MCFLFVKKTTFQISATEFTTRIRQIVGSRKAALETLLVLRQGVSEARFSNIE